VRLASVGAHIRHHERFYLALLLGAAVFVAASLSDWPFRLIAACDTFFAVYLFLICFVLGRTSQNLRDRAAVEDEGILLVVLVAAVGLSCASIIAILHQSRGHLTLPLILALAGAPLGWFALHVVAAFHYANLYYDPRKAASGPEHAPLQFPGGAEPRAWDFLYYAFVVGMTAQVSDVQVTGAQMRRATLGHGVVSFFFNTVLIAMAVNAVVTLAT
jgi:uncharacterized membrane protein